MWYTCQSGVNGNILSVSKNGTLLENYTYDALGQLKAVARGTSQIKRGRPFVVVPILLRICAGAV